VVLSAQASDETLDLRVLKIFLQETFQLAAGIRKEDLRDKLDGRGRALDIEEDDSDVWFVEQGKAGYLAAGCAGMYLGPRQTGS
jgi:hypothetical protein